MPDVRFRATLPRRFEIGCRVFGREVADGRTATLTYSQSAALLTVEELSAGVYIHFDAIALMSAENYERIANIGFVVGGDAVAAIIGGVSFGPAAAIAFGYRWQGNGTIRGRVRAVSSRDVNSRRRELDVHDLRVSRG